MNNKKLINMITTISTAILLSSISLSTYAMSHHSSDNVLKKSEKIEIYSIN